jgi:predicted permease
MESCVRGWDGLSGYGRRSHLTRLRAARIGGRSDQRTMRLLDDIRYALRGLARSKLATAVLLASLALGTGANAVLYSVMDALLFRPPSGLSHTSRLVWLHTSQFNGASYGPSSYPDFASLQRATPGLQSIAAFDDSQFAVVRLGDVSERVRVVAVSPEFLPTIGMDTAASLTPAPGEAKPPAIVSDALWKLLGGPADAVGRTLNVGGVDYVLAAVGPPRFAGLQLGRPCDVWIPLVPSVTQLPRGDRRFSLIARLRDGATVPEVSRDLERASRRLADAFPDTNKGTRSDAGEPRRFTATLYSRLDASSRSQVLLISVVVLGSTALLLLSACVNAGSLLVSRSEARRRELAVKLALGASRRVLVRQVAVESLAISLGGAALGLLLAHWTAGVLPAFFAPEEAAMLDTRLRPGLMGLVVLLSGLAAALFAIGPSRHALQAVDVLVLRGDAGAIAERGRGRLRATIVIAQVALSTVLLIASGVMARALAIGLEGDLAADGRGIGIVLVRMPGALEGDVARGIVFHVAAADAARKLPGVEAAGWVSVLPVGRRNTQALTIETGRAGLVERVEADVNVASAGYFQTLRIPVLDGRTFTGGDGALSTPVVVINDLMARRYFGGTALGRHLGDDDGRQYEVVGVVGSGKYRTLQEAPEPMVYFPLSQRDQQYMHLLVRTVGSPLPVLPALRQSLAAIDPGLMVSADVPPTFDRHLAEALTLDRILTTVVAGCGIAALLLATIGVYGVVGDAVRRRTPEIGLRVALGAPNWQILRLVFSEGLPLTAAGSAAGVAITLLLIRVLRTFVHAVPSLDVASLAVVPVALLLVVVGAAALPTRRALRVSPTIALRAAG